MSIRSIRQGLVIALGLSVSSIALARNPPVLVKQQQAAAHATRASGGYRDINVRFGEVASRSPRVMSAAGGYRDINLRFAGASCDPARSAFTSTRSRSC
jgi:hypothetical protein